MKTRQLRQAFIDYFSQHGHQKVPSASLVPVNDATLLFTNAGMVQFKETFLGLEERPYQRAVSVQRCVRAGGKHNDLENVGFTARHHTFFEMLGNFSFGDYFKRDAIQHAWTFLTQILHLPAERLWVTVYQDDDEAADIWLNEIGVSSARFSRCGEKDNFWSMGDTGPCGPCTEIFYDHGEDIPGGPPGSADADGDRYIEIWNLVFMQFNRDKDGILHPLPKPSVDTGMGLERIAAVVQGVHNNYDIDDFQYLIHAIAAKAPNVDKTHASLKVIADHIRACSFLIMDGVMPSNEGRGYVLRRIIRRAVRHGYKLGLNTPFFCDLVKPLVDVMGDAYPMLTQEQAHIARILAQEENQFAKTLEQGLRLLQDALDGLQGQELPGDIAFKLYDTYGFPLDLTADIAREQGFVVDTEGFSHLMQIQREQSQLSSKFQSDYSNIEHLADASQFNGYEHDALTSKITAIIYNGNKIDRITQGMNAAIVLSETPFYAESGGQVGDHGELVANGAVFRVDDTQKMGQAIMHVGELIAGEMQVADSVDAKVDQVRRAHTRLNHTATHLLHAALKQVVGSHVQQKGSLVEPGRARFDFSHFDALASQELQQLETLVNDKIRENIVVTTDVMNLDDASKSGALALFNEKYSQMVRVLSVGEFSKELCGGTHVKRTGDIGLFKITSEYGVASGVRRIEFVTGDHALSFVNEQLNQLKEAADRLKTTPPLMLDKLLQLLSDTKKQEKELHTLQQALSVQASQALLADVEKIGQVELLVKQLDKKDAQALRNTVDELKSKLSRAVIVLYAIREDKMNVIVGVSKAIINEVPNALTIIRHLCGKGGGRDDLAQSGGPVPMDLDEKLKQIKEMINSNNRQV